MTRISFVHSNEEYTQLDKMIDHNRDISLTYAAMEQFRGKYLVKNRVTGKIYETPQMVYILIAATLFQHYPKETRMEWIKAYYNAISKHEISLPTPVLAGIRTPERQFSSCVLIETGDSLDSICAVNTAVAKYISARAGIGIHVGGIRNENDPVKGGATKHTGKVNYIRWLQGSVKSSSQGGVRGGAATINYTFFDREFPELIVLKNNKGTDDNRIRHLDYCVQLNGFFYRRYIENGTISLFSTYDAPDLYEAFYTDQALFEELYVKYEANPRINKRTYRAHEMMEMIVANRYDTGRIYIMNIDHVNEHGPYIPSKAPIKMTNLCVEITNTTGAITSDPKDGEIALCSLSALNFGTLSLEDMPRVAALCVRGINTLMDHQDYPMPQAERATMHRRPIGVGIINLAYWLAKNGMSYTDTNYELLDEMLECWSFNLIKASCDLAKEQGPCPGFADTKYSLGIFPVDTYKKSVDGLTTRELTQDWDGLRKDVLEYGMANSTILACMPSETSAQIANGTAGIDPIPAIVTYKQSKDGVLAQVAPESRKLKNKYELLWDMPNTRGMLNIGALIQKYTDQSLSLNTSYNPNNYPDQTVPESEIVGDILYAYRMGIKTLYYNNVNDMANQEEKEQEEEEEQCEGCTL